MTNVPDPPPVHAHVATVRPGEPYIDLRQYVEALFHEKELAIERAAEERSAAAEELRQSLTRRFSDSYDRLHELIVTLFAEKDRALQMAGEEREKAASVLREEQYRALGVAEVEREKAASALREALARAIQEGDDRLREHISNQIAQITASLKSAELLEVQRISGAHNELAALIESNTREFRQIQASTSVAVNKAEEAQLRVNQGQNEFRAALSDQTATLMPRREVETVLSEHVRQLAELRELIAGLRTELAVGPPGLSELARSSSHHEGRDEAKGATQTQLLTMLGVLAAVALVVVEFATRAH